MPEYESSMHPNKSDRITSYAVLLLALLVPIGCHLLFGGDIWLTRLSVYGVVPAAAWAAWEFAKYRWYVTTHRRSDGSMRIGNQNLFWRNDRDPSNRRLV